MSPRLHIIVPFFIILLSNFLVYSESVAIGDEKPATLNNNNNFGSINKNSEILSRNLRQVIQSDSPVVINNENLYMPEQWALLLKYGFKIFVNLLGRSTSQGLFEDDVFAPKSFQDDYIVDDTMPPEYYDVIDNTTPTE